MAIAETTLSALKSLSPEMLASKGVISAARKTGYICPDCGNGTGTDGDGITPSYLGDYWSYHCFACKRKFDNLHLLAKYYGLDSTNDFVEVCKRACDEFGIQLETDDGDPYRNFERVDNPSAVKEMTPAPARAKPEKEIDPAELELIRADIRKAQANLDNLPLEARRGLSLDTLREFGCGFISDWTSPKSRIAGTYSTPTPRLIVPAGDGYLARLTVPEENFTESQRKYIKLKPHAGTKEIFNIGAVDTNTSNHILTVTEGEIDAMSIWQSGYQFVVATGGVDGIDRLHDALVSRGFGTGGKAIKVMILFDPDKAGRDAAAKLRQALIDSGIPATTQFLSNSDSKLDANDLLRNGGEHAIQKFLKGISDDVNVEFDEAVKEIERRREETITKALAQDSAPANPYRIDHDAWKLILHLPLSDYDDGNRLAIAFGDRIRFLTDDGAWGVYSDGIWTFRSRENFEIYPYAAALTRFIASKVPKPKGNDGGEIKRGEAQPVDESTIKAEKLAKRWRSRKTYGNAIEMMKGDTRIRITNEDLNNHKNLLNCTNGIVDLETGKLYPHAPKYLLTQKTRAAYVEGYHNPDVDKFLRDIQPDETTRAALIRLLGYAITGNPREEKFGFFTGAGGNGKGTLTSTLVYMLGNYAVSLPIELLITGRPADPNAPSPALASLKDKRIAIVEELPPDAKWDVAQIKRLTGRDPIPARKLFSNFDTFLDPTWTLFMSGNHEPRIPDAHDEGWNRRILKIDFAQNFTGANCDSGLKEKLRSPLALSGLLTVLVEAAVAYHREGALIVSDEMTASAARYLADNDIIASFISDYCEYDPDAFIAFKDFREKLKEEYAKETSRLGVQQINKLIEQAVTSDDKLTEKNHRRQRVIKGLKRQW